MKKYLKLLFILTSIVPLIVCINVASTKQLRKELLAIRLENEALRETVAIFRAEQATLESIKQQIFFHNKAIHEDDAYVYAYAFYYHSKKHNIDWFDAVALAASESHFRWNVVSSAGCIGIFQINPSVWCKVMKVKEEELFNPIINIRLGMEIFSTYLQRYKCKVVAVRRFKGYLN
ncbi:MAG: transglycosylase SLT domain-containing protein [Nitrososphaeria archaeon]